MRSEGRQRTLKKSPCQTPVFFTTEPTTPRQAARYHKVKFVLSLTNTPRGRTHGFAPTTNPGDATPKQSFDEILSIKNLASKGRLP